MNQDTNELLFSYVNGELSEDDAQKIRQQCETDPELARELDLTRAAVRLLAARKPVENRPFFWTRLAARLDAEDPWQAWIWVAKRLIPSMVAATLLVTGVLWYQKDSTSDMDVYAYNQQDDWLTQSGDISKETVLDAVFNEP